MDRERGNAVSDDMIQIQARIKEVLYLRKPASRPVNQSVSRPAVSQSASRPVGQPAKSYTDRRKVIGKLEDYRHESESDPQRSESDRQENENDRQKVRVLSKK